MGLKQYAALLWRWAWLIILATILAAGAAYISSSVQTPVYQASTKILIDQAPDSRTSDYTDILTSERQARTYVELITTRPVLEKTLERVGDGSNADAFRSMVNVSIVRNTQLIQLTVDHTDPKVAADLANTLVEVFAEQNEETQTSRFAESKDNLNEQLAKLDEQIQQTEKNLEDLGNPRTESGRAELEQLQTELGRYQTSYTLILQSFEEIRLAEARAESNIVQIDPATIPTFPIRPRVLMNTVLAGVVGAMLAIGVVFLIEYLDDTIGSMQAASQSLGLPVIGFFARFDGNAEGSPYVATEPRSPISEAFRSLRSNIQFAGVDSPIRTLLITSPGPEEGKSTIAANLALVIAQSGKSVILLDADMRKPRIHKLMGIPNQVGLTDYFKGSSSDLKKVLKHWEDEELYIVPTGELPPNPAELLASEKMSNILDMFKGKYDFVVVDSPPVSVVTDPSVLSSKVDGTLLVVEPKKTKLGAAVQAVEQLHRAGANIIGMVFNNVPMNRAGYYTGYYGGYYYAQYASAYVDGKDRKGNGGISSSKKKKRKRVKGRKGK